MREDEAPALIPKLLILSRFQQGEFRGETYPTRASVACATGGITLCPEQGELGAEFTSLGRKIESKICPMLESGSRARAVSRGSQ